jgi:hypothetical protein
MRKTIKSENQASGKRFTQATIKNTNRITNTQIFIAFFFWSFNDDFTKFVISISPKAPNNHMANLTFEDYLDALEWL